MTALRARPPAVLIAPLSDTVQVVMTGPNERMTAALTLAEAETALGQLATAILAARVAPRGGEWLDRRPPQGRSGS